MASKLHDWRSRLVNEMNVRLNAKWEQPKNDCVALVRSAVIAQTGLDFLEKYADDAVLNYTTTEEGFAVLRRYGVNSVEEMLDKFFERIEVNYAQTGDIVAFESEDGHLVPGVMMYGYGNFVSTEGCRLVKADELRAAWRTVSVHVERD